jgi:hypothetical protein
VLLTDSLATLAITPFFAMRAATCASSAAGRDDGSGMRLGRRRSLMRASFSRSARSKSSSDGAYGVGGFGLRTCGQTNTLVSAKVAYSFNVALAVARARFMKSVDNYLCDEHLCQQPRCSFRSSPIHWIYLMKSDFGLVQGCWVETGGPPATAMLETE